MKFEAHLCLDLLAQLTCGASTSTTGGRPTSCSLGALGRGLGAMRRWDFLNWEDERIEKSNFLRLIWENLRIWDENFSNLRRFFASSISFSRNGQKSSQSKLFGKLYCQKDPKRSKGCFWFLEYWLFMIVPSKPSVCTVDIFKISIKSCCQVVNYDKTSWSSSKLAIRPDRCHHHGLRLCQTPGASLGDKKVELKLSLGVLESWPDSTGANFLNAMWLCVTRYSLGGFVSFQRPRTTSNEKKLPHLVTCLEKKLLPFKLICL